MNQNEVMNKLGVVLLLVAQNAMADGPFWSKTGHRVIGEVAQHHLSGKARKALDKLLGGQSLASVANYADEIKADGMYRKYDPWHYVNYPADKKYPEVPPSQEGDVVSGIEKCMEVIRDVRSNHADRVFHLKLLIHLVGDLHQPMHVGRLEDKGGNDLQVQWFNRGSNLHKIWDTNMIDDYGMSYSELAASLPELSKSEARALQQGSVLDWVEESQDMANQIYDSVEVGEKLYYQYSYVWWTKVEFQLQKGGLRLAKVLNELF